MSNDYADPNCEICGGSGFIYGESLLDGGRNCVCMMDALRKDNMESIWESLSEEPEYPGLKDNPPLAKFTKRNIWITSPVSVFRRHLKATAYQMSTIWDAKVRTDAMILDSWFGTLKAQGAKIYDVEIERSRLAALDIRDLVEPPELCVFVMGTKKLPNKEAPNSILEAISYRKHVRRPTWIVDQPDHPISQQHHLFYSDELINWIRKWPHIRLDGARARVEGEPRITHSVADSDLDRLLDPSKNLSDSSPQEDDEEEYEYEEDQYEDAKTSGTKNLLSTLEIDGPEKKKPWRRK